MCLQPTPYHLVSIHVPQVQLSCEILRFIQEGTQVISLMTPKGTPGGLHWVRKSPKATQLSPVLKQYYHRSTTIAAEAKMGRAAASLSCCCVYSASLL